MAISSILHHSHARARRRQAALHATLPVPTLGLAVAIPALDLIAMLQHDGIFAAAALTLSVPATVLLLIAYVHRPQLAWLVASTLAMGASATLRAVGQDEGTVLSLLSVLALGLGGGFRSRESDEMIHEIAPSELASEEAVADIENPVQLPGAA